MKTREQQISRVTWAGMAINAVLTVFKLISGIFGKSSAMIADGVHSLSDFISDIIILFFLKQSVKTKDKGHDYGHGKFETMSTFILSLLLAIIAGGILYNGIANIGKVLRGEHISTPEDIALVAAIVSILAKEFCYQFTIHAGKKVESPALIANAWHHRSDALSSVGSLLGIAGALFLGRRWVILDPIMGCVIAVVIFVVAVKMALPSARQLLDVSLPDEIEDDIVRIASSVNGVKNVHNLKTRQSGPSVIIDMHITVDHSITIVDAHHISTDVEDRLTEIFGKETQINVHVEPDNFLHVNHE